MMTEFIERGVRVVHEHVDCENVRNCESIKNLHCNNANSLQLQGYKPIPSSRFDWIHRAAI